MHTLHNKAGLPSLWAILLIAVLAACGSDSSDGKTVAVNLSLIVDGRQAGLRTPLSRLFAWLEQWFPGAAPAWAQQAVTDITRINVQVTGPGIPAPASADVPVTDPTSGKEIPVTIQAPVGPNRTITVSAFNSANAKIFGGTVPNVNLTAGAPIDLQVTLVRLFTVTVQKQGAGSGTVTSSPAGIDCAVTCANQSAEFPEGTRVSLNAAGASGSVFAGWGGDCTGTTVCTVEAAANVTALFTVGATNRLTVNVGGPGTGTVTSNPSGILCPPSCAADFATGSTVVLDASATNGSAFNGWTGGGCSGTGPCTVVMVGNPTVSATFGAAPILQTLTVTTLGLGSGTVTSDPPGITECDATCSAGFVRGTVVTLNATPTGGSTFVGWGGACSGTGPCFVDMNIDRSVTASFDPPANRSLVTVQKTGTGSGRVTSSPRGINCGSNCTALFGTGFSLTLIPNPDPGSTFTGWLGNGCFGPGNCTSVINGDTVFIAQFDRDERSGPDR